MVKGGFEIEMSSQEIKTHIHIKLLIQIEKYKNEKQRLEEVRNRENRKIDKEYFQGHIDSLEGVVKDLEELLK
jgi:hypothetical protein